MKYDTKYLSIEKKKSAFSKRGSKSSELLREIPKKMFLPYVFQKSIFKVNFIFCNIFFPECSG